MADWSKILTTELYTALLTSIKGMIYDLAKGFDPAKVTPTNVPIDAIGWSSANNKWQKYNGSSWADLATTYAISISGAAGSVPWSGVTTTPTSFGGYGITMSTAKLTGRATEGTGTPEEIGLGTGFSFSSGNLTYTIQSGAVTPAMLSTGHPTWDTSGNTTGLGVATGTSFNSITGLSSTSPVMDGTATVGTETTVARADHRHPTDTTRQATLVSGTNIKTVNSNSLVGSGNISIPAGSANTTGALGQGLNVGYSNFGTTTLSIYVSVSMCCGCTVTAYINGSPVHQFNNGASMGAMCFTLVVPPGASYQVSYTGSVTLNAYYTVGY